MAALHTRCCAECGVAFQARRSDAERCSARCRRRRARVVENARRVAAAAEMTRAVEVLAEMRASSGGR